MTVSSVGLARWRRPRANVIWWTLSAFATIALVVALFTETRLRTAAETVTAANVDWSSADSALAISVDSLEARWHRRVSGMIVDSAEGGSTAEMLSVLSSMADVSETAVRAIQILSDSIVSTEVRIARVRITGEADAQALASLLYQLEADDRRLQVVDIDVQGSPVQAVADAGARLSIRIEVQVPVRRSSPSAVAVQQ
jgi:hypothetical protein